METSKVERFKSKSKLPVIILSLFLTMVIFLVLVSLERKLVNPHGSELVYKVKEDVTKYQVIKDESDVNKFFIQEKVPKNLLQGVDYITDSKDLIGSFVSETLYIGDTVNKKRLNSNAQRLSQIPNRREIGIKFSEIGEVVGGALKEGDIVDIIVTENKTGASMDTDIRFRNVYVSGIFGADGLRINGTDDKKSALSINVMISDVDGARLDNAVNVGKLKVMKVDGEGKTDNVNISTKVQK